MAWALIRSLRPAQWVKNLFVLAPLLFAHRLNDASLLGRALLAFVFFCAVSSAAYLVNDVRDREQDRLHPLKCKRPVAAGDLSIALASLAAAVLAAGSLIAAYLLGRPLALAIAAYLVLNLSYSLVLKHIVILDVMSIAAGFVLRVLGGSVAVGVEVSSWLVLCTTFLALFLAFAKRRHEILLLAESASGQRRVLAEYSPLFLDQMMSVVTASTVVSYALYAASPETASKLGTPHLIWTLPMVLYGIFRFLYLVHQRDSELNPTEALLADPPFLVNLALWVATVIVMIYVG